MQQFLSPVMGILEEVGNGVIFRRAAIQLEWIVPVLLNIDAPIQIIQTDQLRRFVRDIGEKALKIAGENPG